jgi:hypothetical protein
VSGNAATLPWCCGFRPSPQDCTHFELVAQLDRATDEALTLLAIEPADPHVMNGHGEQPPF